MTKPYPAETLLIEGPDAMAFAHAQFSSNVMALATGHWQFSAWLDPQGRVKTFFHLARLADDQLLLLLRGGNAAITTEALRRFVFRSKLTLTALTPRALSAGPSLSLHAVRHDRENLLLGCDTHSLQISSEGIGDGAWRLPQLREGWPWLPDVLLNELLPPALSLQRLQAVVIDKGCYPGQEIVARLHFRGGNKKHLHRIELSSPKIPGEILRVNAHEKGCLLDVVNSDIGIEALVVLNDDVVAQAINGQLDSMDDDLMIRLRETWNV
jgi:tRNA-modifying protein YgfZ